MNKIFKLKVSYTSEISFDWYIWSDGLDTKTTKCFDRGYGIFNKILADVKIKSLDFYEIKVEKIYIKSY